MAEASDEEIIRRSVEDPEAFGEIFERHHDSVYAYLRRRLGPDEGEELTSQTFSIAFSRRGSYEAEHDTCRPWLLGIAHRLALASARHARIVIASMPRLATELVHRDPDPHDRLEAQRLLPKIERALARLSEGDRETFLLYALGELTYEQVASVQGIPTGTVRSRIHRARRALREPLGPLGTRDVMETEIETPDERPNDG